MKQIILFLFFTSTMVSQDKRFENLYDFFLIDNGKIVWQKVYESNLSESEIKEYLSKDIVLSPIAVTLSGHTNIFRLNKIENYGIMPGWEKSDYQAYVSIEVKEGKYRVTVTDIKMDFNHSLYDPKAKTFTPLENFQLDDNDKFSNKTQGKKGLNCINLSFLELFKFKKSAMKSDW